MIIKVMVLFLIGMGVLAMFGRLKLPGGNRVSKCRRCGRYQIGKTPCNCKGKS